MDPEPDEWSSAAAYNLAAAALGPGIEVVFKCDADVLPGDGVLEAAARLGRERLCVFTRLSTTLPDARYPRALRSGSDLDALAGAGMTRPMDGEGIVAFPRRWFAEVGGYDRGFRGWGFEDSDLRARAARSIGVTPETTCLLVHQWHPVRTDVAAAGRNRARYDARKRVGSVVVNDGRLVPDEPAPSPADDPRIGRVVFATRSLTAELYELSDRFLRPDALPRHRVRGAGKLDYFRRLTEIDADWVVNIDEDAFLLSAEALRALVRHMADHGYAACGMPDGGAVSIRRHNNPLTCNAFFNVLDLRRVRRAWADWPRASTAGHDARYESIVSGVSGRQLRTGFDFASFEPYGPLFFALLAAGERILYLDAEQWRDGVSTLLKSPADVPLLLHTWYSRLWDTDPGTRRRIEAAAAWATEYRGLTPAEPPAEPPAAAAPAPGLPPAAGADPAGTLPAERFGRAMCINLDHRTDRWASVSARSRQVGLELVRVPAVDGRSRTVPDGTPPGVWGCSLSHLEAWWSVLENGPEAALILEDDAEFHPQFAERFPRTWAAVPDDWHVVYLARGTSNPPSQ